MKLNKDRLEGRRLKIEFSNDGEMLKGKVFVRAQKFLPWRIFKDHEFPTTLTIWATPLERRSALLLMYKEILMAHEEERPLDVMTQMLSFVTIDMIDPMFDEAPEDVGV